MSRIRDKGITRRHDMGHDMGGRKVHSMENRMIELDSSLIVVSDSEVLSGILISAPIYRANLMPVMPHRSLTAQPVIHIRYDTHMPPTLSSPSQHVFI
jgi:hypothetical protein